MRLSSNGSALVRTSISKKRVEDELRSANQELGGFHSLLLRDITGVFSPTTLRARTEDAGDCKDYEC